MDKIYACSKKFCTYLLYITLLHAPIQSLTGFNIVKNKKIHTKTPISKANKLNWIEITNNVLSTKIIFDFAEPVYFTRTIDTKKHQLKLLFHGMNFKTFNATHALDKFNELQKHGISSIIKISEEITPSPHVLVMFTFAPEQKTEQKKTTQQKKLLVKWSTLQQSHRLVMDIFLKENLDRLIQNDSVLLHASNIPEQKYEQMNINSSLKGVSKKKNHPRIIIDPGHGGNDLGAQGKNGLLEKDIALDIAKNVHKLLKKNHYQSFLTRTRDKEISLIERSHLAQQFNADFFISIHVNASQLLNNSAYGIETFYLQSKELLSQQGKTGFLFVNFKKDISLIKLIDEQINNHFFQSKNLATSIQTHILKTLKKNNITTNDRGVKKGEFRVLLQTGMPTALVEVGFLTHQKEAKQLAKSSYRKMLAQSIFQGIVNYFTSQNSLIK